MKVNVWGINYSPDQIGIAPYSTDLCEYLVKERQYEVTMVTGFSYYPTWKKRREDRDLYATEWLNGVKVERCWQYVPDQPTVIKRIFHEVSFVSTSFFRQLFAPAPDVYLVVSPPLLLGAAAWVVASLKRAPFVFHVQDLQPDAAVSLGMMKDSLIIRVARVLEKFAYDRATMVSAVSELMCKAIEEKAAGQRKVCLFPNWVSTPERLPESGTFRKKHGFDPLRPIVSYAGNLGVKQRIGLIIEAARALDGKHPALFVIAGGGGQRVKVEEAIANHDLKNLVLLPVLDEEEHWSLLVDSDICLITAQPGTGAAFFPSKLLKILAVGRPVLTNAEPGSALSLALQTGHFGQAVAVQTGEALGQAVVDLLADSEARQAMSLAGKEYVANFEKSRVLSSFSDALAVVTENRQLQRQ